MRDGRNGGAGMIRESLRDRLSRIVQGDGSSGAAPQPDSAEALAGPFIDEVRRIWEGPHLAAYLSAPEARRHVWHCWIASDRDTVERRFRGHPALALRRLTFRKARDLLAGAYGACPPGLVTALGRCGKEARSPAFYRALVRALKGGPESAKAVWHASTLPDALVFRAAGLSAPVAASHSSHEPLSVADSHLNMAPFPAPPWAGTALLRPLTCRQDLRDMGRRLRNCMRSWERVRAAAEAIEAGREAYFAWDAPEPGLIRFVCGSRGWCLAEWKGEDNRPLSTAAEAEIIAALAGWPGVTVSAPRGEARRVADHRPRFTPDGRRICRYTGEVRD